MRVAWEVRAAPELAEASEQLAREEDWLASCAAGDLDPLALIWRSRAALVASRLDANTLPQFAQAAKLLDREGWPVSVRSTGGSAVALDPGVVNISLFLPWRDTRPTLEAGFALICTPIIQALADVGIRATTGAAAGSFCDGRFNVLVGNRKIAGTSQRHASRRGRGALLAHATVIVDSDPQALTDIVQKFYQRAGSARRFEAASVTSLAQSGSVQPRGDRIAGFTAAIARALA